jgi:DNA repair exonuclease SbcCD ATPase subunit
MNNETLGGWGEYQRLVLAELERHNTFLQSIDGRIQSLKLELELIKQSQTQDRSHIENLETQMKENTKNLNNIKTVGDIDEALKKYRNWIVGLLFIFVSALLIPTVNLIIHALSGG